jgi:predicted unusual protein kinase regulating ubiquinone biosynthesis (AarF/ABC1/UbiB family)
LKWEAYNLQLFARNFHGETDIKFPAVSAGLVSDCVMIESWINGKVVQDIFTELGAGFIAVERKAEDAIHAFSEEMVATKKKLAKVVLDMNMKMFLRDNYVHGDLHGGNLVCGRHHPLSMRLIALNGPRALGLYFFPAHPSLL